jgi:hexokinase
MKPTTTCSPSGASAVSSLFEIDEEAPTDRERRQLIDRLVDLIKTEDAATLAAAIAQTEILLRMKRERQE